MGDPVEQERRAAPRTSDLWGSGMHRARLRPGRTAEVVDLSTGGALIETDWRLLPGARVELQLGEPVPVFRVAGRILRCHVARVGRNEMRYRGALKFDHALPVGELTTPAGEPGG